MLPSVATVYAELSDTFGQARRILAAAGPDQLNRKPGADFNSPYAIGMHMAGSLKWWVGQVLAGRDVQRDREGEFRATGDDVGIVFQEMDHALALAQEVFETVTVELLLETRPVRERTVTVEYIIVHVLQHSAIHLGHLEMTQQLGTAA